MSSMLTFHVNISAADWDLIKRDVAAPERAAGIELPDNVILYRIIKDAYYQAFGAEDRHNRPCITVQKEGV